MSLVFDAGEPGVVVTTLASPAGALQFAGQRLSGRSSLESDWRWLRCGGGQRVSIIPGHQLSWGTNNDQQHREEDETIEDSQDDEGQQNQEEISEDEVKLREGQHRHPQEC